MYLVFCDSSLIYYIISRFSLFTSVTYEAIVVKTREKKSSSLLRVFSRIFSVHVAPSGDVELLCFLQFCLLWPWMVSVNDSPVLGCLVLTLFHRLYPCQTFGILYCFATYFAKGIKLSFPDLSRKMQHDSRKAFFFLLFWRFS